MMRLGRYSFGIGDRFGCHAAAQLEPFLHLAGKGVTVTPVWNKSYREHKTIGSDPGEPRARADEAVKECSWESPYFVDADHINMDTVDDFAGSCDFFTIDVASRIGAPVDDQEIAAFTDRHSDLDGKTPVEGIHITTEIITAAGRKYLAAVREARRIYERITEFRKEDTFVVELSMDETSSPQSPEELLCIMAAVADENIPVRTLAPRFSGRFNKGVEYIGDPEQFRLEFLKNVRAIEFAVSHYDLPDDIKLSVHSGSDKFAIYAPIREVMLETGAGVHVKTAGTTWLAELIGLAESGGEGAELVKDVYQQACSRIDELSDPYREVIDIDSGKLPSATDVRTWDGEMIAGTLRHDRNCPEYNPDFRQLMHLSYKIAAEMGGRYKNALRESEEFTGREVSDNIARHLEMLFTL